MGYAHEIKGVKVLAGKVEGLDRGQLRAHYDAQVTAEETAREIAGIIERFRRG